MLLLLLFPITHAIDQFIYLISIHHNSKHTQAWQIRRINHNGSVWTRRRNQFQLIYVVGRNLFATTTRRPHASHIGWLRSFQFRFINWVFNWLHTYLQTSALAQRHSRLNVQRLLKIHTRGNKSSIALMYDNGNGFADRDRVSWWGWW